MNKKSFFIIFLFHRIVKYAHEAMDDFYTLPKEYLVQVLKLIDKTIGIYKITTISEVFKSSQDFAICLSFDDGFESDYTIVAPLFLKKNIKGTFFITTDFLGKNSYLKISQVKELHRMGMEIGSHSKSHPLLTMLSKEKIKKELLDSKKYLEDIIGDEVKGFSSPGGYYNKAVIDMAFDVGYKYICNSEPKNNLISLFSQNTPSVLGRIALHKKFSLRNLEKILLRDEKFLKYLKLQYLLKNIFKKTLGVERYLKLRKILYGS